MQIEAETLGLEPVFVPQGKGALLSLREAVFDGTDAGVAVSFGYRLPAAVVAACRAGMINVHPSLLPRLRGAAPVVRTMMGSDEPRPLACLARAATASGVSIITVEDAMDSGAVLSQEAFPPLADDDAQSLTDVLAPRGAELVVQCLAALQRDERLARGGSSSRCRPAPAPPRPRQGRYG